MKILVTGGAGYVGSHVCRQLVESGHEITVFDNLSSGHRWATLGQPLVEGDLADTGAISSILEQGFDAVMHFAASIDVAESMREPLRYYANNTRNTLNLLNACKQAGIDKLIFSSTAAVYGTPSQVPVTEGTPLAPINPYGASKMMSERMLADQARASDLRFVSLRYFNVAGADPEGRIGEAHEPETHIIPLALQVASGRRQRFTLYGDDYDTPDGTCIRDYIHVEDLARAHSAALDYLAAGGDSATLNCGYGHGFSVQEVLAAVRRITGRQLPVQVAKRRVGDPPLLVAASDRIRERLGWVPRCDDLDYIVETAWRWERILSDGGSYGVIAGRRSHP